MDSPARWLGGRHRVLRHDAETIAALERLGPSYARVAVMHLLEDAGLVR